jgi:drug/metabolite transporter (DMT)-like permease|tara:strand:+ start:558 stop:1469 length:912 start_codon:yes stop_codon:yes gene_type:complete
VKNHGGLGSKNVASSSSVTVALVILTALFIGLNYTVMKWALDHTTPLALAALRTSVGAPFLLAIAMFRGEKLPQNRQQWMAVWWISLAITTVSSGFLVLGISRLSPGLAAMLSATMPLFTAIIAVLVLAELPGRRGYLGLLIGLFGAVCLAMPAFGSGNTTLGIVFSLISSISWAAGAVLNKRLPGALEISPLMLVALQITFSAVCLHLAVPFVEDWSDTSMGWGLALPLLYAGIPSLAVTFYLFASVLRRAPAIQGAAVAYLTPFFGVLFSWLLVGDRLGTFEILGGALVVTGVALLSADRR